MSDSDALAYRLKVDLSGLAPEVHRVLRVDAGTDLAFMHEVLQVVMGWEGYHLYTFVAEGKRYGQPRGPVVDAAEARLRDLLDQPGDSFTYIYDFGDEWRHRVQLQEIVHRRQPYPICLQGSGACPPEDCGGVPGYRQLLDALGDEQHRLHGQATSVLGEDFAPESFDCEAVSRRLQAKFDDEGDGCVISLQEVFEQFLQDQQDRLSDSTYRSYQSSIEILRTALNSYGYNHAEISYDEVRAADSTFCEAARPDLLLHYLSSFYGYFLPRKMWASESEVRHCGTTIRRLLQWMGDRGLLTEGEVSKWRSGVLQMTRKGRTAARARSYCYNWPAVAPAGEPDEVFEDHAVILEAGSGRLNLEEDLAGEQFGWVRAPVKFTKLCSEGMTLSVELLRFGDRYLTDVFNVYP